MSEIIRPQLTDGQLLKVTELLVQKIGQRLERVGRDAYVSQHEAQGRLEEETYEAKKALHENDIYGYAQELMDVATVCVIAVASMVAGSEIIAGEPEATETTPEPTEVQPSLIIQPDMEAEVRSAMERMKARFQRNIC